MPKLRIVANAGSQAARANARGHLFEGLVASLLRNLGFEIDTKPSINYAGMEIDIVGHDFLNGVPLYAECKCYETEVDCPKFQAFYGKYMSRWLKDNRCRGLFLALPGVNSHARGFYEENCRGDIETAIRLLQEDEVIESLLRTNATVRPETVLSKVPGRLGTPGDQVLLYSDYGYIWVQYITSPGSAIPDKYTLFDSRGNPISDSQSIDYVQEVSPDIAGFEIVTLSQSVSVPAVPSATASAKDEDADQIVEVRGSSAWFEYQFPASPEFFVGRSELLIEVEKYSESVLAGSTSARGLLFTGNSGWGKSSAVLASADLLRKQGHFAVVIDCRSMSSPRSVLRVVDYTLQQISKDDEDLFSIRVPKITGFEGALNSLLAVSNRLKSDRRLAFLFFDQFENVFFLPEALNRIRDLLLKICDHQANIILGFAWKTDLIGATNDFPFKVRDALGDLSKKVPLDTFSDIETNELLDKLRGELRTELRKDLRFFLSEFSQGLPWLLKKLCAHVKAQREAGIPQSEIANRLLNIEQLFKDDLSGLTPEQEEALKKIAKAAPVGISDLSEHYNPQLVQTLVDKRLVVRIGTKYDIYWDIFRDYLNYGRVPVQDNYLPKVEIGAVLKATKALLKSGGHLTVDEFRRQTKLSEHSAMNVVRDMRLLGLAAADAGKLNSLLLPKPQASEEEVMQAVRLHLKERLVHNRLVSRITSDLKAESTITITQLATKLSNWCPYIRATPPTWRMYARVLARWMDLGDLATYNHRSACLDFYESTSQFRKRDLNFRSGRRTELLMPIVQYTPVERVALVIASALEGKKPNWKDFKKSTLQKAFTTLEALSLIYKTAGGYRVGTNFITSRSTADEIRAVFAAGAKQMPSFMQFLELLSEHQISGCSQLALGRTLRERLGTEWKDGTGKTVVKIMLDWARHTELAPGIFALHPRKNRTEKQMAANPA